MSEPNVNPSGNVSSEINIKRLGSQQKDVLRFLYENAGQRHKQVDIIETLHGEVTDSRKASMSRTVTRLIELGLVDERQSVWIEEYEFWSSHRVNYAITDKGEVFLETDDRFPQIGGGDDE